MWAILSGLKFHKFPFLKYSRAILNGVRSKLLPIGNLALPQQEFCLHLNVSQCAITESSSRFVVTVYNPRSREVTTYVRLPVMNGVYTVLDPDGIIDMIKK